MQETIQYKMRKICLFKEGPDFMINICPKMHLISASPCVLTVFSVYFVNNVDKLEWVNADTTISISRF